MARGLPLTEHFGVVAEAVLDHRVQALHEVSTLRQQTWNAALAPA